jgi:hypothetical protein
MKISDVVNKAIVVGGVCLIIFYFIDMLKNFDTTKPKPDKYSFEAIPLPDGTPCYVIRGGTHSGIVGVTCNYRR